MRIKENLNPGIPMLLKSCFLLFISLILVALPASAKVLKVQTPDGAALENVVIVFKKKNGEPIPKSSPPPLVIGQQQTLFVPFVSAITADSDIIFTNQDSFRHHVYSFSKAKSFEISLFARDKTNRLKLEKPGIISIGCNIHDNMLAYIYVAESGQPFTSFKDGSIAAFDLEAADYEIDVWYPSMKKADTRIITLDDSDDTLVVKLDVKRQYQKQPEDSYY